MIAFRQRLMMFNTICVLAKLSKFGGFSLFNRSKEDFSEFITKYFHALSSAEQDVSTKITVDSSCAFICFHYEEKEFDVVCHVCLINGTSIGTF